MQNEKRNIRILISIFMLFLILSGATVFPLQTEVNFLTKIQYWFPQQIQNWIGKLNEEISVTPQIMFYGTDWLGFAHVVIAVAFIGPLLDPVKNIWVIQFGMISCIMVFPLAFIAGPIRGIPFYWQLIDCSFGIFAFVLLYYCYKNILKLERLQTAKNVA